MFRHHFIYTNNHLVVYRNVDIKTYTYTEDVEDDERRDYSNKIEVLDSPLFIYAHQD